MNFRSERRRFDATIHVAENDAEVESLLVPETLLGVAIDPGARLE